jgi:hypothetical protein
VVTYADILRDLEPLNKGRDDNDRITYDSLWVHAKSITTLPGQRPTGEPGCTRS